VVVVQPLPQAQVITDKTLLVFLKPQLAVVAVVAVTLVQVARLVLLVVLVVVVVAIATTLLSLDLVHLDKVIMVEVSKARQTAVAVAVRELLVASNQTQAELVRQF
jgi:hypothetical protein